MGFTALISYRPFRNFDPPALAEVWRSQIPLRGLAPYVTASTLDDRVFSMPYFDRRGLVVAVDEGRAVGFAHAGFAANDAGDDLDRRRGVISRLMVGPHPERTTVLRELAAAAQDYLVQQGAQEILAGGVSPADPFYLGLYGGAGLPGILARDDLLALFRSLNYSEQGARHVLQRSLASFKAPVDRDIMLARRQSQTLRIVDPKPHTWWEAVRWSQFDRTRFELRPKSGGEPMATATFWEIQPLSTAWGVRTAGLCEVTATERARCDGSLTMLLSDAMKQLASEGFHSVETIIGPDQTAMGPQFQTLGFQKVDEGVVLRLKVA